MVLRMATVLLCLAALAGCTASAAPTTDRTITMPSADGERTALVHRPGTAGPGAPLVIVLHGAGGSGAEAEADLGWNAVADREGFVVAYPDGLNGTWNGGACCGTARTRGVDDVGFLRELTSRLTMEDGLDPHRVYAVGFSNGGILAYAWACTRPGDLAGVGPVAGAVLVGCPAPAPLTVVAVHGTADDRVPFAGGPGAGGAQYPTVDGSLAPFLAADGCAAQPEEAGETSTWTCKEDTVVRQVIDGGGHAWPAGTADFLWSHLR
jgi:polyhydroxybutyrate depolymerase